MLNILNKHKKLELIALSTSKLTKNKIKRDNEPNPKKRPLAAKSSKKHKIRLRLN